MDDSVMDFGSVPVFGMSQFDLVIRNTENWATPAWKATIGTQLITVVLNYPGMTPGDSGIAVLFLCP